MRENSQWATRYGFLSGVIVDSRKKNEIKLSMSNKIRILSGAMSNSTKKNERKISMSTEIRIIIRINGWFKEEEWEKTLNEQWNKNYYQEQRVIWQRMR